MRKPTAPSQLDSNALWALLPMEIRILCSYRRYDPDEPFYTHQQEAWEAGTAICDQTGKGMVVSPVLIATLPQGKLILARDICEGAEQRVQELLAVVTQHHSVHAEMAWELGFL